MAKISDFVEALIKQLIEENNGVVEITRSELAERANCVPSQITYVLSTRFTNSQGYVVESRRGGGGWIRIRRGRRDTPTRYLMHPLSNLESRISEYQADVLIRSFLDNQLISPAVARVLCAAVSDQSLRAVPADQRDFVRMTLFKNALASLIVSNT
jgi:transcriptional regulator CtsR